MEVEKCIGNVKWIFLDNYKSCRDLDLTPACSPLVGKFWRNISGNSHFQFGLIKKMETRKPTGDLLIKVWRKSGRLEVRKYWREICLLQ